MPVINWTEITSFHNINKYAKSVPEILNHYPSVMYRAKIKLHGNNAAIQIHSDDRVLAQSRTTELSPGNDLAGFAKWVEENASAWRNNASGLIVFGEWCGHGIQSGTALNNLHEKIFAVFAARWLDDEDSLIVDPEELQELLKGKDIPGMYILPWHNDPIEIDWCGNESSLDVKASLINEWVLAIEQNDPWVEKTFNIKGTGEGLVFYPISKQHLGYKNYCNLVFKAKGEAHRVVKTKTSVQVNPEAVENSNLFVDMVLTTARLEQGVRSASVDGSLTFSNKFIGKFINWILNDVQKETTAELEASGLQWKQVQKLLGDKSRNWYLSKMK